MPRADRAERDDDVRETPPVTIGAVTLGTVPLPFLAVYATLFILHGWIRPVHPPDITSSQQGELIAGIVTAVVFVVLSVTIWMFVGGTRRWPFAAGQFAVAAGTVWVIADSTRGGTAVAVIVLVTSVTALVLAFAPASWEHVGNSVPAAVRTHYPRPADPVAADGSAAPPVRAEPTLVQPASALQRGAASPGPRS